MCSVGAVRCFHDKGTNRSKIAVLFFIEAVRSCSCVSTFYSTCQMYRFVQIFLYKKGSSTWYKLLIVSYITQKSLFRKLHNKRFSLFIVFIIIYHCIVCIWNNVKKKRQLSKYFPSSQLLTKDSVSMFPLDILVPVLSDWAESSNFLTLINNFLMIHSLGTHMTVEAGWITVSTTEP